VWITILLSDHIRHIRSFCKTFYNWGHSLACIEWYSILYNCSLRRKFDVICVGFLCVWQAVITKNASTTTRIFCACLKYWSDVYFLQPFIYIILIHQVCPTTRLALWRFQKCLCLPFTLQLVTLAWNSHCFCSF